LSNLENKNNNAAVIPFFNESKSINEVIQSVLKYVDIVIAVNDGSADDSIERVPADSRLIIISHNKNLGKGKALRTGILKSIELNTDITITLDADLQHDTKYIPKFIEQCKKYEIVLGNRMHDINEMPIQRKMSNFLTSFLLSKKLGIKISDSQCGYRAYRTNLLKNILPKYSGFEAESEMLIKSARLNYSFGYVNIPTIYNDEQSKMRAVTAIWGFIKVLLN